ncbi:MAG TPA: OsmC family protein [Gemmatimonadaceae bacterium]|nr:OsmC family protein [Gemmatimonadaceae bacterium]
MLDATATCTARMKITLLTDDSIRLEQDGGPMTIEAPSADVVYSAFQMLASGLAFCTDSVVRSWASNAGVPADDLTIEVSWTFADKPHRVDRMEVKLSWPSLPEQRVAAAERVAGLCGIHSTLTHSPELVTKIER